MDFNLTDEQQMLREGARRFVRDRYDPEHRRQLTKTDLGFSQDNWNSYADLGWFALGLPEDVGGLACSFVETVLLMEEFGRGLALEPFASTAVLCAHLLERGEDAQSRAEVLGAVAEGRRRIALAHLEPGARQPDFAVTLTAECGGATYVLDGVKTLAFDAPSADQLIVSAQVKGEAAFSLFLVEAAAPGLSSSPYELIDESRAADLRFTRVTATARIAGPDTSPALLAEAMDRDTLARVAEALGAMEAVLSITSDYIKTRVQFGQAICKFQALQHRMAEMFVEVQEVRSILFCGLAHLDAEPAKRSAVISAAKVVTADAGKFVGSQAIQLHGGYGVTDEYAVSHYYKKLLAFDKIHGDTDWHLDRYAEQVTQ